MVHLSDSKMKGDLTLYQRTTRSLIVSEIKDRPEIDIGHKNQKHVQSTSLKTPTRST